MQLHIIASSTMVHQRVRCMICDRPVDHRVVFMTNDARVLHAGCIPDHVKVPTPVLLQAIRRLERMLDRARTTAPQAPDQAIPPATDSQDPAAGAMATPGPEDPAAEVAGAEGGRPEGAPANHAARIPEGAPADRAALTPEVAPDRPDSGTGPG